MHPIVQCLSDDLRRPQWRGSANQVSGHCYVASEALWHVLGGRGGSWRPMFLRWEGSPHWYLQHADGTVLDVTASQFESTPDYGLGRGKGFLTSQPSKRAQVVLARLADL